MRQLGILLTRLLIATHVVARMAPQILPIQQPIMDEMIIVNTIDGNLHGIQRSTGKLIWSKSSEWVQFLSI